MNYYLLSCPRSYSRPTSNKQSRYRQKLLLNLRWTPYPRASPKSSTNSCLRRPTTGDAYHSLTTPTSTPTRKATTTPTTTTTKTTIHPTTITYLPTTSRFFTPTTKVRLDVNTEPRLKHRTFRYWPFTRLKLEFQMIPSEFQESPNTKLQLNSAPVTPVTDH